MAADQKEIAKLVLSIEAQLGTFKSQLKEAGVDIDDLGKKAKEGKTHVNTFLDTFKGFVAAQLTIGTLRMAFGKLVSFINDTVDAYKEEVKVLSNLRTVLGYTSDTLIKQSKILAEVTAVDDEMIMSIYAIIGAFTKEENVIKKLTPVILDFAKAHKDMSPESAAQLFTKAIYTNTDALARYIGKTEGAVGSTERINNIIKKSTSLWGGLSESFAKTDVGRIEVLKNKIEDMKETIGKNLLPAQKTWYESLLSIWKIANKIVTLFNEPVIADKNLKEQYELIKLISESSLSAEEKKKDLAKQRKVLDKQLLDIAEQEKKNSVETILNYDRFSVKEINSIKIKKGELEIVNKLLKEQEELYNPILPQVEKEKEKEKETKKPEIHIKDLRLLEEKMKLIFLDMEEDYRLSRISTEEYYEELINKTKDFYKVQIEAAEAYKNKLIKSGAERNEIEKAEEDIVVKQAELSTKIKEIRIEKTKAIEKEEEAVKNLIKTYDEELTTERKKALEEAAKIDIKPAKVGLDKELQDLTDKYNAYDKTYSDIQKLYDKDTKEYQKALEDKKALTEWYNSQQKEIEDRYAEERKKAIEETALFVGRTLLSAWSTFYDVQQNNLNKQKTAEINYAKSSITNKEQQEKAINNINQKYEGEARKIAEKKRKIAIMEATIDMYASAMGAYRAFMDIDIIGPALGAAAAAAALAFGMMKIAAIASAQYFTGGKVRGRQGRDKVNAKLTAGEYVASKPAVDYYGESVMEAINQRVIPRSLFKNYGREPSISSRYFNSGALAASSGTDKMSLQINNIVDTALIGKYINSSQGQKVILNVIYDNQYNIKRTLQI